MQTQTNTATAERHSAADPSRARQRARRAAIERAQAEARQWSRYVDTLLEAYRQSEEPPPVLGAKMEALRNKRDTVATKVEALKRHRTRGWSQAQDELNEARRALRDSWRNVISTLDKECLYV